MSYVYGKNIMTLKSFYTIQNYINRTVGNQADMTSSSIFQSLNIGMNTSIVTLSYPKPRFWEIKLDPGKGHHQKICS
jgi:hypothetical protein